MAQQILTFAETSPAAAGTAAGTAASSAAVAGSNGGAGAAVNVTIAAQRPN